MFRRKFIDRLRDKYNTGGSKKLYDAGGNKKLGSWVLKGLKALPAVGRTIGSRFLGIPGMLLGATPVQASTTVDPSTGINKSD